MVLRRGYTYYVFFDIDGRYWVLQVIDRFNYITYEELVGVLVSCFPSAMCGKMIGGVVRVDVVDVDYYTIMYFRIGSSVVRVVSGGLKPFEGKMVFVHGLRYGDLIKKISSNGDEAFFRNMFYMVLAQLSDLEGKCRDTVEAVLKNYSDAFKHVKQIAISTVENTNRMLGFIAKPEAVMAAEAALSMVTPQQIPATGTAIATPVAAPKKGLFERIKEKIVSLFSRRKKVVEGE